MRNFSVIVDFAFSLLASLLAILLVRWVSDPIPGYSTIVLRWLLTSAIGSLVGFTVFRTRYYSVRYISSRQFYGLCSSSWWGG